MCFPVGREKRRKKITPTVVAHPLPYLVYDFPRLFFIYPLPIFLVNQVYTSNGNGCIQLCFLVWFPSG